MNRRPLAALAAITLLGSSIAQQLPADNDALVVASPLLRTEHLVGDQYVGFTQSCLLVYSDGQYHREIRRQSRHQGARGDWDLPEVFEGWIDVREMEKLKETVESEEFSDLVGTIGDASYLRSRLRFGPLGVIPHSDIEIFEAAVAHSGSPQVFEVFGPTSRGPSNSLSSFKRWVAAVEKQKEGRTDRTAADSCAVRSSFPEGSPSWKPNTTLIPRPSYTPEPDCPSDESSARTEGKVTVRAEINWDGTVGAASVLRGLSPVLDQCALTSIKRWKFVPAQLCGVGIAAPVEVQIGFDVH